jgi:uncharacterized protein
VLDLLLPFTTGLLASLHCVGMCGGFVAAYSLRISRESEMPVTHGGALHLGLLRAHLLYNAGRLTTYTFLGGLMGIIGSFVAASGQLIGVQGLVSVLAGGFMILLGLSMGRWLPYVGWLQPIGVSHFGQISNLGEQLAGRRGTLSTYPLGLLLGFMPCGPLYAMEINAAATGSPALGMLTLLAFGLGTVPTLYAFGLLSTTVGHRLPRRFFQAAAVMVVLLGTLTLMRGLAMNGLVPHSGLW